MSYAVRKDGLGWRAIASPEDCSNDEVYSEIEPVFNPPPAVPAQVTRAQGKAALIQAGLWSDVLAFVDGIADPTEKALAEVALHDTTHWQRSSPFLNAAATALGMSGEQLDGLFQQADEIQL